VASFVYGPFGEVVAETGSADHRRQFNGKENDVATGLRYYGYRYYDPLTLRWSSADPLYSFVPDLGLHGPQRMNLYTFSLNNPVRYYDPDGREAKEGDKGDSDPEPVDCGAGSEESSGCDGEDKKSKEEKKQPTTTISVEDIDRIVQAVLNACTTSNCALGYIAGLVAKCPTQECVSFINNRYSSLASDKASELRLYEEIRGQGPKEAKIGNPPPKSQQLDRPLIEIQMEQGKTLSGPSLGAIVYKLRNPDLDPTEHKQAQAWANMTNSFTSMGNKVVKGKTVNNLNSVYKVHLSTRGTLR
jgi:RHS repeat-associated protein